MMTTSQEAYLKAFHHAWNLPLMMRNQKEIEGKVYRYS